MNNLKLFFLALGLGSTTITTAQTTETKSIAHHKQVAGYYQHQLGNLQITALLDGTNVSIR